MSLIVETGAVISNANTYISLDYADTYCEDMGYTAWASCTETEREAAILRAMRYIEGLSWKGIKYDYDDALKWPRSGVYDEDGYAIDYDEIPTAVKKALAQAAYEESQSSGVLLPTYQTGIKREKIDVIEIEYFGNSTVSAPGKVFDAILSYVKGLIEDGSNNVLRT